LKELQLQFEDVLKNVNALRKEVPVLVEKAVNDSIRIELISNQQPIQIDENALEQKSNQTPAKKSKTNITSSNQYQLQLSEEHSILFENLKENLEETVQLTNKLKRKLPDLLRKTRDIQKFRDGNSNISSLEKALVDNKSSSTNKRKRNSLIAQTETPGKQTRKRLATTFK
jgi:hypothetical protein